MWNFRVRTNEHTCMHKSTNITCTKQILFKSIPFIYYFIDSLIYCFNNLIYLMGNADFSKLAITLRNATEASEGLKAIPEVTLRYGVFINTVLDFTIVAFAIFIVIKQMNRFKKAAPVAAPTTKACPKCCSTIPTKATRCPSCTSELQTV